MNLFSTNVRRAAGIAALVGGLALTTGIAATYAQEAEPTATPSAAQEEAPGRRNSGNGLFGGFFGERRQSAEGMFGGFFGSFFGDRGRHGEGMFGRGMFDAGPLEEIIGQDAVDAKIANILGMSLEDFQSARESGQSISDLVAERNLNLDEVKSQLDAARTELIQQAVTDGKITQEQADQILNRQGGRNFGRGRGRGGPRGGMPGGLFVPEDVQAAVAAQLGISVEQLTSATEAARAQLIQQAVADGMITQDQADQILSTPLNGGLNFFDAGPRSFGGRRGLHGGPQGHSPGGSRSGGLMADIVGKGNMQTMVAEVLGVTVDDLSRAHAEGKTLADLLAEKNMTAEQFDTTLDTRLSAAIDEAVTAGTITQTQADQLLAWVQETDFSQMLDHVPGSRARRWLTPPSDDADSGTESDSESGTNGGTNDSVPDADTDTSASAADGVGVANTGAYIPLVAAVE